MRTTGIIQKVDDMGRIAIPKEIRQKMRLEENTPMELLIGENEVIFRKYFPSREFDSKVNDLHKSFINYWNYFSPKNINEIEEHITALKKILEEREG